MNTQTNPNPVSSPARRDAMGSLATGEARRLGREGGELTVVRGSVWLTRRGDLGDHVLAAGQRVRLGVGEEAVIEAWDASVGASVRWQPRRRGFVGTVLAEPLRGVAFVARRLALACAAIARGASRAEGRLGGLPS